MNFSLNNQDEYSGAISVFSTSTETQYIKVTVKKLSFREHGMEADSGAYYGHELRLMVAKFVSPYRMAGKSGKNDAADAHAICETVRHLHMRFESQLAMQCLHRTRQGFIEEKTAIYNRLRELIPEFGVIVPQRLVRWSPVLEMHMISRMGANWLSGWG